MMDLGYQFRCLVALGILALLPVTTAQAQSLSAGEVVFVKECSKCHQIGPGAKNRIGPQLNGIVGRKAGSVSDFKYYSEANRTSGTIWTEENLQQFIKDPRGMIVGTTQVYKGLEDSAEIEALIAYLKTMK